MGEATQRHRRIFRLQRALVAGVAALVVLVTGTSATIQTVQNHQASETAAQVAERADFWRVIGREARPDSTAVMDKFAIDLREAVGPIDPSARELPTAVTEFRAGPNDYGGIEDKLGFNPFNNEGQSCDVCGSLSVGMQDNLLLIKQGQVDQIIHTEAAAVDKDQGLHLTPFDMSLPLWLGIVYLSTTTAALVIAVRRDSKRYSYRPNVLTWGTQGGTEADLYRRLSKALSPAYFVTVLPLSRKFDKTKDYGEILQMTDLQETERSLREVRAALNKLPTAERDTPEVRAKLALLDDLQNEIMSQIEHYDGDVPRLEPRNAARVNMKSIDAQLEEAQVRVGARREALKDLDQSEGRGQTATG